MIVKETQRILPNFSPSGRRAEFAAFFFGDGDGLTLDGATKPFEIESRIHGFRAKDPRHCSASSNRSERVNMLGQETANSSGGGAVASVRGSVVDVRFDKHLPPIRWICGREVKGASSSKCWRN